MREQMKSFFSDKPIKTQMLIMVSLVVLVQLVISGIIFSGLVADFTRDYIGEKALSISETIAEFPVVKDALVNGDKEGHIQEMAEAVRVKVGAQYVVIADRNGTRLSHPNTDNIGKKFQGGDTDGALKEGRSYISSAVGTLGPSVRGITPVFSDGVVVGFVAVGYLSTNIRAVILEHQKRPLTFVMMMLVTGFFAALLIAEYQKRITLGLEPAQIADLYLERTAIIDSIRAGVIAINDRKEIRMINKTALRNLNITEDVTGKDVGYVFPTAHVDRVLASQETLEDTEIIINGLSVLCNIMPVKYMDRLHGAVITFRRKDELNILASELNRVRECSDMLRVQSHEYSNKLHTIAGLIQLEAYQEAQELILSETQIHQEMMNFVTANVPDQVISAVIMGKHSRARELKIDFSITKDSRMADIPAEMDRKKLVTILGNILDNAFDAVRDSAVKQVELSMSDSGDHLVFRVEDSGHGIDMAVTENIFQKGISTKGEGRGIGLYLVQRALIELKGSVGFSKSRLGGVMFRISIPKGQ